MLQAMNTGHDGSLTTTHANSPIEAIARIETLCLMSGLDLHPCAPSAIRSPAACISSFSRAVCPTGLAR